MSVLGPSRRRIGIIAMGLDELAGGEWAGTREAAIIADELGVDLIAFSDHVALSRRAHAERAGFPYPIDVNWHEPLVALTAVAAVTTNIRLGASVLIAPMRPPLILAKQLGLLDHISGGRVEIGLGSGWQAEEFTANGSEFKARAEVLDEQMEICRALWGSGGEPVAHHGKRYEFTDLVMRPTPPQGRDLPVLLGGKMTASLAARIVEHAQGWTPAGVSDADLVAGMERIAEAAVEAGRDPADFIVTAGAGFTRFRTDAIADGVPHPVDRVEALWGMGADLVLVHPSGFCKRPEDIEGFLRPLLEARAG